MKYRILSAIIIPVLSLFTGFSVGMGTVNLFPDRCSDGTCFTFLGWVGWEATTGLGIIVGGSIGLLAGAIILLWPQKLKHPG